MPVAEVSDNWRLAALRKLVTNLPAFSPHCLRITDKRGEQRPLVFNRAQLYTHEAAEQQRRDTGMVRAIVLKGRQQGISTYIGARFYQRVSTTPGMAARVMAHLQDSTDGLFGMVKRYQDHNPIAPAAGKSNEKELAFSNLDSLYKVATAGSKEVGRGTTVQLLHGSEIAFWKDLAKHMAGLGNAVADMPGTEVFLESTANGIGNGFHTAWEAAIAGESQYLPIFVPWYWQPEYCLPVPPDFVLTSEEKDYMLAYGVQLGHMVFRRRKIAEYDRGFEWLFNQEYPAVPALAFNASTADPLISPLDVGHAQKSDFRDARGPRLIGCDPAEEGKDRTVICWRRGRVAYRFRRFQGLRPMEVAGKLALIYQEERPDAILVDKIGIGAGIVDRLHELNVPVIGVNSAERADDDERYANKRAEMWWRMKQWIEDRPVRIVDDLELQSDLIAPGYTQDSKGRRLVESKKSMKKRGIRSPDFGDALALTFAEHIEVNQDGEGRDLSGRRPASAAGY